MHRYIFLILWMNCTERVTGMRMTTKEIVTVSQNHDSSNHMATKQFLII